MNLRANPGTNYAKVGSLNKGTKIEILDYIKVGTATWGQTAEGWVHLYYVKLDAPLSNLDKAPEGGTGTGSSAIVQGTGHTLNIAATNHGKISASATVAGKNTEITLTATPDTGYTLDQVVVKDAEGAVVAVVNNKFTMPDSNVTVTATFRALYTIKTNTTTGGKVTANATYRDSGEEVVLTVAPEAGYELESLSVVNTNTNASVEVSGGKFIMPKGNVNVVAAFKKTDAKTYEVKINSVSNGKVTANTTTAKENDTITLTVVPADNYVLEAMTIKDAANNVVAYEAVSGKENTYSFKMPAASVTIATSFQAATYTVSINNTTADMGTVSVNPAEYVKGATVTLVVNSATEQHEVKTLTVKSGDTEIATKKVGNNYTFTMPAGNVTVSSAFDVIRYALTIAKPTGGTVTADKETYAKDELVTVTVNPDAGYTYGTMTIKSGDKEIEAERSGLVFTFKMPGADVNLEHEFEKLAYELKIEAGEHGKITADKESYGYKDKVTLTVKADKGYALEELIVMNGATKLELKKNGNKYTFEMPAADGQIVVSATYKEA